MQIQLKKPTDAIKYLSKIRVDRGIPQESVAKSMKVGQPKVSRMERGDDVQVGDFLRYAYALGFKDIKMVLSKRRS